MTRTSTTLAMTGLLVVVALIGVALVLAARLRRSRFGQRSESELMQGYLDAQDVDCEVGRALDPLWKDKVVLVFGGGGSIGGRLVELLAHRPARKFVVVDHDENGLYRLQRRLQQEWPAGQVRDRFHFELADVVDEQKMAQICRQHRPHIAFHYANYKSSAFGNKAGSAFVNTNIGGTLNILRAMESNPDLERFVYISSDKAESASQNYGRTKRICEILIRTEATIRPEIEWASLRYCNVLDAAGSFAIPTFREQILNGHRVTVRKLPDGSIPDRFFISLDLAASLAMVTARKAKDGNILSLDADRIRPVRIDEVVRTLAIEAGISDVDAWLEKNIDFVPAEVGEKGSESLGSGEPLPDAPLVTIADRWLDDPALVHDAVRSIVKAAPDMAPEDVSEALIAALNTVSTPRSAPSLATPLD